MCFFVPTCLINMFQQSIDDVGRSHAEPTLAWIVARQERMEHASVLRRERLSYAQAHCL